MLRPFCKLTLWKSGKLQLKTEKFLFNINYLDHHQPINIPTAGEQAFLVDTHKENGSYPTTRAQCALVGANDCKCNRDNGLTCLPKRGGGRVDKFVVVTHR
jgi:hypothetical protein